MIYIFPLLTRGGRYVLIIHFYAESGQKMIQFNIWFKIELRIFIQTNYSFKNLLDIFNSNSIQKLKKKTIQNWFSTLEYLLGSLFSVFWLKVGDECMYEYTLLIYRSMAGNGLHYWGDFFRPIMLNFTSAFGFISC